MPGKIFINYRRDDAAGDARGIRDALAAKFGKSKVFMDVDDVLAGQRFDVELAKALDACDVLIAVIGPRWVDLLKARMASRDRDYVRAEIAEALKRGLLIIPVRVGQEGRMPNLPRPVELPADINRLLLHQKHDVAHERFGRDVAGLVEAIRLGRKRARAGAGGWGRAIALAALLLAGGMLAYQMMGSPTFLVPRSDPEAKRPTPPAQAEVETIRKRPDVAVQSFRDCPDCPEMVVVPAGSFMMGSPANEDGRTNVVEGRQRRVTIGSPFAVGKYEVTFAEWDACVAARGCKQRPGDQGWGRGKRPVINVSWNDITKEYLPWLSRNTGKTYRLLTEAEWEYVARAGSTTPFWWGNTISTNQANYDGRGAYGVGLKGEYRQKTVPVDSFAANAWGLYNVHGNVFEWVQDCYSTDSLAWTKAGCSYRVWRGGAWSIVPQGLRSADRGLVPPHIRSDFGGFRLARAHTP